MDPNCLSKFPELSRYCARVAQRPKINAYIESGMSLWFLQRLCLISIKVGDRILWMGRGVTSIMSLGLKLTITLPRSDMMLRDHHSVERNYSNHAMDIILPTTLIVCLLTIERTVLHVAHIYDILTVFIPSCLQCIVWLLWFIFSISYFVFDVDSPWHAPHPPLASPAPSGKERHQLFYHTLIINVSRTSLSHLHPSVTLPRTHDHNERTHNRIGTNRDAKTKTL